MKLNTVALYVSDRKQAGVIPPSECIEHLFVRQLKNVGISACKQVNIWLTSNRNEEGKKERFGSTIDYYLLFDHSVFEGLTDTYSKKKYLLDALLTGIIELCGTEDWDSQPFHDAYRRCIEVGLNNEWFFKNKLFKSPNKRYYFGLLNVCDIGSFEIFEVLFDQNKTELVRRRCFKDDSMAFNLISASWDSSSDFFVYKFDGPKKEFNVDIQQLLTGEKLILPKKVTDYFKIKSNCN